MERYLLLELMPYGEWIIFNTFFNQKEAEQACNEMSKKYPSRSFSLKVLN